MRSPSDTLPVIGITMGDPVGIGPEIIIKALSDRNIYNFCRPIVIGDKSILEREVVNLKSRLHVDAISSLKKASFSYESVSLLEDSGLEPDTVHYGQPTSTTGRAMASYILRSVSLAKNREIDAIVTAPINKKSLNEAGYDYPGHTEMLATLTDTKEFVMMLAGEKLRVVLVTIHCALSQVPRLLSSEKIIKTIRTTHVNLKKYFSLTAPRIAVAGLNPHAGESGIFGKEESEIIAPAVQQAQQQGIDASGPYPPDTLFYHAAQGAFDAVVCMYHDQGLIPLKLLHFDDGVNITLGLPIIRTSVDHGTAYDIAGRGIANPASLLRAIRIGADMAMQSNHV